MRRNVGILYKTNCYLKVYFWIWRYQVSLNQTFFFFSGKNHLLALLRNVNDCIVTTILVYAAIRTYLHCSQQKE